MDEEREKKLKAGKEKFAQLMRKKQHSQDFNERKKKRQKKSEYESPPHAELALKEDSPVQCVSESEVFTTVEMATTNSTQSIERLNDTDENVFQPSISDVPSSSEPVQNNEVDHNLEFEKDLFVANHKLKEAEIKLKFEEYNKKIEEYKAALGHRDEIISQLTKSLQVSIEQRNQQEAESTSQAEFLASEINTLKLQLKQASEFVRNQKGKNGISAQELLDVKNQVIFHQQSCHRKDDVISNLNKQIQQMKRDITDGEATRANMKEAMDRLNSCLYHERRDADAVKMQHVAEIKRLQQIHSEDLKHLHGDSEHRYKQTVNELNGKLKQMQNDLLSFKGIATELEMCKKKHANEIEQLKNNYIDLEATARRTKDGDEKRIKYLETKIESFIKLSSDEQNLVPTEEQDPGLELEDQSPRNSLGSQGWSIDINLDDISSEIQCLRDENEQLKTQLFQQGHSLITLETVNAANNGDAKYCEQSILENLWKSKYDALLEEKLHLEMQLTQCSKDETKTLSDKASEQLKLQKDHEQLLQEHSALKLHLVRLQDDFNEQWRSKYDALLQEKSQLQTQLSQCSKEEYERAVSECKLLYGKLDELSQLQQNHEQLLQEHSALKLHQGELNEVWKLKCDTLLEEKTQLEMQLTRCSKEEYDRVVKECKILSDKVSELLKLQENYEQLLQECSALKLHQVHLQEELNEQKFVNKRLSELGADHKEKYLNALTALESEKLRLQSNFEEFFARYETLLKEKQEIENSLHSSKENEQLSMDAEMTDPNEALHEQISFEKQLSRQKLLLCHEKEIQNVLSNKVAYFQNKYMICEQKVNDLKHEVTTLHDELAQALKQQTDLINELATSHQKYSLLKFEVEKGFALRTQSKNFAEEDDAGVTAAVENFLSNIEEKIDSESIDEKDYSDDSGGMEEMLSIDPESDIKAIGAHVKMQTMMDNSTQLVHDKMFLLQHFNEMGVCLQALQQKVESRPIQDKEEVCEELLKLQAKHSEVLVRLKQKQQKSFGGNILDKENVLEETLRQGKELLQQKLQEKEIIEEELVRQKVELEHCSFKERHLQEMLSQKESFEQDLLRQQKILEEQLLDMEHRLKERERILFGERAQLQREMQMKDLLIRKWKSDFREKELEYENLHGHLRTEQNLVIATMRQQFQEEGFQRIEQMQNEIENYHTVVISQLKENLQSQFAVRESQLLEQYSLQVSHLKDQHKEQIALMQAQYEKQMSQEKCDSNCEYESLSERISNALNNLRQSMDEAEQNGFDQIHTLIQEICSTEMEKLKQQTDNTLTIHLKHQKEQLELLHRSDLAALEAKLTYANNQLITNLKAETSKAKKDDVNGIIQQWQSEMKQFQNDYNKNLGGLLGVQELSTKSIYAVFQHWVLHDFKISTMKLTQQWESKYVEQLAKLREEIEEKFKTKANDEDANDGAKASSPVLAEESFSHLETLLEEREEIVKKTEEIRHIVESTCDADMKVLKQHLQDEFESLKTVQDVMNRDIESGQSSVIVELHKLKEEYDIMSEKYEEITKEDIVIKEYPLTRDNKNIEEVQRVKEQLEHKHANEMEELRIYFEKQCENMEKRYNEEVCSLKVPSQSSDQSEDYVVRDLTTRQPVLTHFCDLFTIDSVNVNDLEEHYKKELAEKLQEYCEQLEISKKDLEYTHAMKIKALEEKYRNDLQKEIEDVRMDLGEAHSKQMEELLAKQMEMMAKLRNKYSQDLTKEITQVKVQCNSEINEEIENACQKVHNQLKQEHQQKLQELQHDLELRQQKELEIIHSQLQAEKSEEINAAITKLRCGLQQQRQEVKNSISSVMNENILDEVSGVVSRNAIDKAKIAEQVQHEVEDEMEKKYGLQIVALEDQLLKAKSDLEMLMQAKAESDKKQKQEVENLTLQLSELKLELESAMKEHSIIVEALKEEFQEELGVKDVENDQQLQQIKNKLEDSVKAQFECELKELQDKHESDLGTLKTQHAQELADERIRLQEELTTDHITKFEVVTHAIDKNHEQELETLKQTLLREREECINQLRHDLQAKEKEYKVLIAEMQENHERDIEELKQVHAKQTGAEVRKAKQEMESHSAVKLQAYALDTEVSKSEMEALHRHEILELHEKLQNKYREEMDAELFKTIEEVEAKHEKLRTNIHNEHRRELAQLRNELQEAFDAQQKSMEKNLMDHKEDVEEGQGDRKSNESCTEVQLLQHEVKTLKAEHDIILKRNEHLKLLLMELLQSYFNVEVMINGQLAVITSYEESMKNSPSKASIKDNLNEPAAPPNVDMELSFLSEDENEQFSKKIPDDVLAELDDESNAKDFLYATTVNLQSAVKRLLNLLATTVQQCHESKVAQLELINAATSNDEEAAQLLDKNETLQNQLKLELKTKDQLTVELHKAAGLINGYESEKLKLEEMMQKQEEVHHTMIEQLQLARDRIQELESNATDQKHHLEHQRALLAEGLSDAEKMKNDVAEPNHSSNNQELLDENSKLYDNNKELKQQTEKERQQMLKRVRSLEVVIEEEVSSNETKLSERSHIIEDLRQQVDALEKQLRSNKQFIEEQIIEREQEREESQRQIENLQLLIKDKERQQSSEGWLARDMEMLNEQLQQKSDELSEEIRKKEEVEMRLKTFKDQMIDTKEIVKNMENQLQSKTETINNLNEEIKNLKNVLSETYQTQSDLVSEIEVLRSASSSVELSHHVQLLEERLEVQDKELEILNSSQSLMKELQYQIQKMEEKVDQKTKELEALQLTNSSLSSPSSEDISLKDQLEVMRRRQSESQEGNYNPVQDMRRLEDKLEALSKAEEAAVKKMRDLEMLWKKQKHMEEELLQDKETLQQQVNSQLLQISSLQSRIEERRHNLDNSEALNKISQLQEAVDRERDALEKKDKEVDDLQEQVVQLKQLLVLRESEVANLTLQASSSESLNMKQHELTTLQKENQQLKVGLEKLNEELKDVKMPALAQSLIEEKNQEIDFLTKQLDEVKSGTSFVADSKQKVEELEIRLIAKEKECEKLKSIIDTNAGEIEALDFITSEKEKLELDNEEKAAELKKYQDIADQRKREVEALKGVLKEKEELLEQVSSLQLEQKNLTDYQHDAEMKIVNLTSLVDEKENCVIDLKNRLDLLARNSVMKQNQLQNEIERLKRQLSDTNSSIEIARHQLDSTTDSKKTDFGDMVVEGLQNIGVQMMKLNSEPVCNSPQDEAEHVGDFTESQENTDIISVNEFTVLQKEYEMQQIELEQLKSAEVTTKMALADMQSSLNELTHENAKLQKKILMSRGERQKMQKRLQTLERENKDLVNQLQVKREDHEPAVQNEELAALKNEILRALETSLKSIQVQLSEHGKKTTLENEKTRVTHDSLIQTRGELQQLQQQMQKISQTGEKIESIDQINTTEAEKKIMPTVDESASVQILLTQSENERLQDEIDRHEETIHQMQSLLNSEQQKLESVQTGMGKEIEKLHGDYRKQIDHLKLQLQDKSKIISSDSSSASDISQGQSKGKMKMAEGIQNIASISEQDESVVPIPEKVQSLLKRVHKEGVEMLSLSELYFLRYNGSANSSASHLQSPTPTLQQAWENEKHQLMSEIMALKALLSQATDATASLRSTGEATTELANSLLRTVALIFERERAVVLAELRTHILSAEASTPDEFQRLEHRLNEMEKNQNQVLEAVQQIFANTKQTNTIDNMTLMKERLQHHQEREKLLNQIRKLERDARDVDNHLKQQVDLLEYRIRQDNMFKDELHTSLEYEKKRTLELTSQLSREKSMNADLEIALALTRTEVIKCQTALDKDQREIQNLKIALESERFRSVALNQALESEQANFNQLQEAMEAEKRRTKASSERQQRIIQELQHSLQKSKENHIETTTALERERINVSNAYRELESMKNKINSDASKSPWVLKSRNSGSSQSNLNRVQDLSVALERERHQVKVVTNTLYQERTAAGEELERERTVNLQLKRKLELAKDENVRMSREMREEKEQLTRLESELKQIQKQLSTLRENELKHGETRESERRLEREQRREIQLLLERERQKQQEQKLENHKMQQKISLQEKQIQQSKDFEQKMIKDLRSEQEQHSAMAAKKQWSLSSFPTRPAYYDSCVLESARQQLYCLLQKSQIELEKCVKWKGAGDSSSIPDVQGLLKQLEKIQLEHVPSELANVEEIDLSQFAEQVLHQNAELIGFVSKLCEEKMELRKMHTKLEDRLLEFQHKKVPSEQTLQRSLDSLKETLVNERSTWAEEKANLQLALHRAEARTAHHSSEMGSQNLRLSQEVLVPKDLKAKQWQLKYLKAESFRKALIYQKKYLLILLGGFQDTEAATLASIARLGIQTTVLRKSDSSSHLRKFRSCVRVCIAISRMKFLAKRWNRIHSPSPFGSTQELYSQTSQDFSWKKFHRIGTTPPVKDWSVENRGSEASSERSISNARRNLNYISSNLKPSSSQSLQQYIERVDSLQSHLGLNVPTTSNSKR